MSSLRKQNANRANARLSTGPQTQEGKAASKQNAMRHGLCSRQVVIDGEDPAAYEALRQDLLRSYRPFNAAEKMLVEEIAQNSWRLQRARAIESATFNLSCAGGADPIIGFRSDQQYFDTLRRYMTSIERAWHRAQQQLDKLQAMRPAEPPDPAPDVLQEESVGFVSHRNSDTYNPDYIFDARQLVINFESPNSQGITWPPQ